MILVVFNFNLSWSWLNCQSPTLRGRLLFPRLVVNSCQGRSPILAMNLTPPMTLAVFSKNPLYFHNSLYYLTYSWVNIVLFLSKYVFLFQMSLFYLTKMVLLCEIRTLKWLLLIYTFLVSPHRLWYELSNSSEKHMLVLSYNCMFF